MFRNDWWIAWVCFRNCQFIIFTKGDWKGNYSANLKKYEDKIFDAS